MNLPVKPSSFFTLIVISLQLSACHPGEILNPVISKTISNPIKTQWLGFGYNQDPLDRNKEGHDVGSWDNGRWELTKERVNYIRPSLVRINLYRHWFNPSGVVGVYEWDSPSMQSLYQVLDYYKEKNIPVMTGLWQSALDYKDDVPFYTTKGHGSFQQMLPTMPQVSTLFKSFSLKD